jgi:DNA/RNA-binding domain of Phe-tRNA-synthetase-like protein
MTMMTFDISAATELFTDLMVAFLITSTDSPEDVHGAEETARRIVKRVIDAHETKDSLTDSPLVESYRKFYSGMNVRPSSASTPIKQALRVFEKGYRPILPIVDTAMEIEYATLCSFQVYDLNNIGQNVAYARADGTEVMPPLAHSGSQGKLRAGELLLVDELGIINSSSCGNAAGRLVSATSSHALVRIMKIPEQDRAAFDASVKEAGERMSASHVVVLDESSPRASLEL